MNLEWYVFYHDVNKQKIIPFNIFAHSRFSEDVEKNLKKIKNRDEFAEKLRSDLFYYFGCKCEYEVVIISWPPLVDMKELDRLNDEKVEYQERYSRDPFHLNVRPKNSSKVDIYTQVMNNFGVFLDYVWNNKDNFGD